MSDKLKKAIKPMVFLAIIIFAVCCLVSKPETAGDYFSYAGYAAFGVTAIFGAYNFWLWKWINLDKTPVLDKKYDGKIYYCFNGVNGCKDIDVEIKQTRLDIQVQTKTDINSSSCVAGMIVKENGKDVLYYNYITNPDAMVLEENPIQHGTCRIELSDVANLKGQYWTTSHTVGDIVLKKSTQK